jgi:hypothetical protein
MFLLEYDLVADYLERRSEFREDHLALATGRPNAGTWCSAVLWRIPRIGPSWSGGWPIKGSSTSSSEQILRDQRLGAYVVDPIVDRGDRHGRLA